MFVFIEILLLGSGLAQHTKLSVTRRLVNYAKSKYTICCFTPMSTHTHTHTTRSPQGSSESSAVGNTTQFSENKHAQKTISIT